MHRFALSLPLLIAGSMSALAADPQIMISIKDHQFLPSDAATTR
jgi:hypothetical protein